MTRSRAATTLSEEDRQWVRQCVYPWDTLLHRRVCKGLPDGGYAHGMAHGNRSSFNASSSRHNREGYAGDAAAQERHAMLLLARAAERDAAGLPALLAV